MDFFKMSLVIKIGIWLGCEGGLVLLCACGELDSFALALTL